MLWDHCFVPLSPRQRAEAELTLIYAGSPESQFVLFPLLDAGQDALYKGL